MKLVVNNVTTKLISATYKEIAWLDGYLSFKSTGLGGAEKAQSLYDVLNRCFPTGLLDMVRKQAISDRVYLEISDARKSSVNPSLIDLTAPELGYLRPYQREALQAAIEAGRGILELFTGAGKTEIAIGLHLALSQQKPIRTLMIVTAQNLLHQTAQRYHERTSKVAGIVGDGSCSIEDFTVATFQSLHALTKKDAIDLTQFDCVLMDECHTTAASTYWDVTKKLTHCYYRIALSATALKRADKKDLYTVAATGNVLYRLSIRDGVELNAVAPPSVYLKRFTHQNIYPYAFGDVYKYAIANSTARNLAGISLIQTAKKPTIAFVKHKEHGDYLLQLIKSTQPDLRVMFVHGKSKKELQQAKKSIEENGLDVLISTDVLATGTDIPEIMSLVNLAGMKAEINVIQKVGRAARKYKNGESIKDSFEVYDLLDEGTDPEHQSHKWLIDHANERLDSYKSLGFGVHIM